MYTFCKSLYVINVGSPYGLPRGPHMVYHGAPYIFLIYMIKCGWLGCHVKSDYARTTFQHTPCMPYTSHLPLDFQQLRPSYSLPQPHHITASHHSRGDKPPERVRTVRNNTGSNQKDRVKLNFLHIHQGSPLLPIFCSLSRGLHHHPPAY